MMYICIYIKDHDVSIKYFTGVTDCKAWLKDKFNYTIKQRKFTDFHHIVNKDSNIYIKEVSDHIDELRDLIKVIDKKN